MYDYLKLFYDYKIKYEFFLSNSNIRLETLIFYPNPIHIHLINMGIPSLKRMGISKGWRDIWIFC